MTTSLVTEVKQRSQLSGGFTLRSGRVSSTYFDKYQFEADPWLLRRVAESLAELVPSGTEIVAGLELGGIPLVAVLAQVTGLPAAFVRKEAKTYGTCRYAEGAALTGKRFVLVEDVVSSGGALLDALSLLRRDGLEPIAALCVVDRQTGGREARAEAGLPLLSVFTTEQLENA